MNVNPLSENGFSDGAAAGESAASRARPPPGNTTASSHDAESIIATASLEARVALLETENAKLRRIRDALIERVEASNVQRADPYAAFEHSVVLAEQVRERTEALNLAMAELKTSNRALTEASREAEMSHLRLVDAIESVSDAFVLYDANKYLVLYNSKFAHYWRGTGLRIEQGMHLNTIRKMAIAVGMVREESREGDGHTIYRMANNSWVQVSEWPTHEGGLVMLYTDISELKASEEARREDALAQKSRLLQQTVDNLSQGVTLVNGDGELEVWNSQFLALAGLNEAAVSPSMPFTHCMLNSQLALPKRFYEKNSGRALEQRLADGRVIEIRSHAMHGGGFVNTYTDVTENYLYAETLRESERWVRLITDHVPAMIAYVGGDLCFEFTNKVYDEWYGWSSGALLGKHMREVHGGAQFGRLKPYMDRALAGESVVFDMAEKDSLGREAHLLRSYVPNIGSEGKAVGFFVLVRDVTERRKTAVALQNAYQNLEQRVRERTSELTDLNDQLRLEIDERSAAESRLREAKREAEQANLSKTKFLAAVSHDLLQPLNAARLFTSALLEQPLLDRTSTLVHSVSSSLEDVENLLGTLVDISKLDAGVIKPDITAFRVGDLLDNLANEYHEIARSESLALRFVPSSAVVLSDSQLLARILRNFLTNAMRYTSQGRILLGCRRLAAGLSIEVWDTGTGIPEDKLTEIFQEFKRALPPHAPQDKGLGLGLAIVDKISRMLGHPVAVSSVEGQGSCFSVLVPYGKLTATATPKLRPEPSIQGCLEGMRVWVIDNDASICRGMQTLLDSWGCNVVTALSLHDLEQRVDTAEDPADAIIADYHLDKEENGEDLVATVNARRKAPAPVLMITANYSNELKKRMRQLGYLLINKPVRPMKLKSALMHLHKV